MIRVRICKLNVNLRTYIHIIVCSYINFTLTDPPPAPMNIRFPPDNITNESFVIQWDAVNDFFAVNYTVTWYRGDNEIGMASVDEPPYTVTGLTANTSYSVTVVAINTCCGAGPVSDIIMVMTNMTSMISPTTTRTTATPTPTTSPSGNVLLATIVIY